LWFRILERPVLQMAFRPKAHARIGLSRRTAALLSHVKHASRPADAGNPRFPLRQNAASDTPARPLAGSSVTSLLATGVGVAFIALIYLLVT
jgi:hypothetical protein